MTDTELQVSDLLEGDGKAVVKGALITTHYRGTLADGSEFDSSHSRGKPFQCVIGTGRVIKGCVPAHLAYGERGMGSRVAPGADLTFEIELLEVLTRDD